MASKMANSSTRHLAGRCLFLEMLPIELRQQIYSNFVTAPHRISIGGLGGLSIDNVRDTFDPFDPVVFFPTNSRIRNEAYEVFFRTNRFRVMVLFDSRRAKKENGYFEIVVDLDLMSRHLTATMQASGAKFHNFRVELTVDYCGPVDRHTLSLKTESRTWLRWFLRYGAFFSTTSSPVRLAVKDSYHESDTDEEGLDDAGVFQRLAEWAIDSSKAFHNGEISFDDVLGDGLQASGMSRRQLSLWKRAAVKASGKEKLATGDVRRSARIKEREELAAHQV